MKKVLNFPFNISLFLILSIVITVLCALVFVSVQQVYRQSANDPQIQLSEDMARYLAEGKDVKAVMPPMKVDVSKSLVWIVTVYDAAGAVVESNAMLDGQVPVLPAGVLENAKQKGQNRVTWEPKEGVRIAAVVTAYDGGYVLAGRSLRETEDRIEMLGKKVFIGWVVALGLTFVGSWLLLPKRLHS